MDKWYFIKLEVMNFLTIVYINNPRLEDKEKTEVYLLLKDVVSHEILSYYNDYETLNSLAYNFFSNQQNIFMQ